MAFCPYCGTPADGRFCGACGKPLPIEEAVVSAAAEETALPVNDAEQVPEAPVVEAPVAEEPAVAEVAVEAPVAEETAIEEVAFEEPAAPVEAPAPIGYDPETGAPIYAEPVAAAPAAPIGYDPETGAPIYAEPVEEAPVDTKATKTAFILSIVGLCLSWIPWFIGLVCAAPAVVFAILAWVKKSAPMGKRIAATAMAGLAVLTALIVGIVTVVALEAADEYYDDYYDDDYSYDYDFDLDDYYDDYDYDYDYGYSSSSVDLSSLYYRYCDSSYAVYSSSEDYLYIDTNPYDIDDYFKSEAWEAIKDVNDALGLPKSVSDDMYSTTSLDGEQYKFYDDVSIMWTYHPDEGLEVIYMER